MGPSSFNSKRLCATDNWPFCAEPASLARAARLLFNQNQDAFLRHILRMPATGAGPATGGMPATGGGPGLPQVAGQTQVVGQTEEVVGFLSAGSITGGSKMF